MTSITSGSGDQVIGGATTIELTDEQRQQASASSSLWAQGGTPDDPVLAQKFPGPQYGFAALRCATDAVNGDNVEYHLLPGRRDPHLLLRVLCRAAADIGDDHDPKARRRRSGGREPGVRLRRVDLV